MDSVYEKLIKTIDETKVKLNESMKNHTSFKAGGNVKYFVVATTIEEIQAVLQIAKEEDVPLLVMGNGSNILFRDEGFQGIVLQIKTSDIEIHDDVVTVDAGVKNAILAHSLLQHSLTGYEFAAGIPGTVGGAIRMNAGAYGGEMKDLVETVIFINDEGKLKTIENSACDFAYRHSIFCEKPYIIVSCTMKLQKGNKEEIQTAMDQYMQARREKQPLEYASAGSTFKRGTDFITAKLIDDCGLKGFQIGGAAVSEKHAGFIINKDNATATDIIEVIEHVQKIVNEKTGKKIELEVEIV